ncbi:unnamed protein product, partial [Phaeothamnion confervicola]
RGVHHPPRNGIPGAEPGALCDSADGGAYDAAVPYRDANGRAALLPAASSGNGNGDTGCKKKTVG